MLLLQCRFTVGQLSVSCWYTVGQLSAERKPTVGRQTFRGALLHFYPPIFLDRDGHLHCQTIKEKHGLPFCSWVQSGAEKPYMSMFSPFSAIFAGPRLLRIKTFATMATWRDGFSSLLRKSRSRSIPRFRIERSLLLLHPTLVQCKVTRSGLSVLPILYTDEEKQSLSSIKERTPSRR